MKAGWKRGAAVAGVTARARRSGALRRGARSLGRERPDDGRRKRPSGITVTGVGIVKATPDTAEFSFGVETQGATSTEALQKNGAAVKKVIEAIKAAGVAPSDIQTQTVSVFPRYTDDGTNDRRLHGRQHRQRQDPQPRQGRRGGRRSRQGRREPGLRADADASPDRRASTTTRSARRSPTPSRRRSTIAGAAGVCVGKVVNIVEGGGFTPLPAGDGAEGGGGDVPIEPGLQEVQATMIVTFAIVVGPSAQWAVDCAPGPCPSRRPALPGILPPSSRRRGLRRMRASWGLLRSGRC